LAGPLGTPLTAAVPAPGAPALGVPTALPLPMLGPLAAPVVDVPPPEVPPADPPPLLCASASVPVSDKAVAVANAITVVLMWYPSLREGTTTRDNLSFQKTVVSNEAELSLRPRRLREYIGQQKIKDNLAPVGQAWVAFREAREAVLKVGADVLKAK